MYTLVDFARTVGSKDKQPRKRSVIKRALIGAGVIAGTTALGYGAGKLKQKKILNLAKKDLRTINTRVKPVRARGIADGWTGGQLKEFDDSIASMKNATKRGARSEAKEAPLKYASIGANVGAAGVGGAAGLALYRKRRERKLKQRG